MALRSMREVVPSSPPCAFSFAVTIDFRRLERHIPQQDIKRIFKLGKFNRYDLTNDANTLKDHIDFSLGQAL
jgi:hemerythrin superfamily protein